MTWLLEYQIRDMPTVRDLETLVFHRIGRILYSPHWEILLVRQDIQGDLGKERVLTGLRQGLERIGKNTIQPHMR